MSRFSVMTFGNRKYDEVPLTQEQFNKVIKSLDTLFNAIVLEQKFHLLLRNYAEFEDELLRLATHAMLFTGRAHSTFSEPNFETSRRLVNVLTTARLYIDHIKHDISTEYGKESSQYETIENEFRRQYDGQFGYQVMEALRNFVQHRGLPLHMITFHEQWIGDKPNDLNLLVCTPFIGVQHLSDAGGFKAVVLEKLQAMVTDRKPYVDAKPFLREYLTGLMAVHAKLREVIKPEVDEAEQVFRDTVRPFLDENGKLLPNVAVFGFADDGREDSVRFILPDLIDRREHLKTHFFDLSKQCVSSIAVQDIPE